MRWPSTFSEIRVRPSFLRTTPAKKPRTECCCQPVVFMIVAIVVPLGCLRRARTASCLVPARVEPDEMFLIFAGFLAPLPRSSFVFLDVLLCNILGSFRLRRHHVPSPPKPHSGDLSPAGRIPDEA